MSGLFVPSKILLVTTVTLDFKLQEGGVSYLLFDGGDFFVTENNDRIKV